MAKFKGGSVTMKQGGVGCDDYLFRRLPAGRWVYVRLRHKPEEGGWRAFNVDKEALSFILQDCERVHVGGLQKILANKVTSHRYIAELGRGDPDGQVEDIELMWPWKFLNEDERAEVFRRVIKNNALAEPDKTRDYERDPDHVTVSVTIEAVITRPWDPDDTSHKEMLDDATEVLQEIVGDAVEARSTSARWDLEVQ